MLVMLTKALAKRFFTDRMYFISQHIIPQAKNKAYNTKTARNVYNSFNLHSTDLCLIFVTAITDKNGKEIKPKQMHTVIFARRDCQTNSEQHNTLLR